MDRFTRGNLEELIRWEQPPCVTLQMPTHPAGRDGEQDVIRLKNLVREAEQKLERRGVRPAEARDLLAFVSDLPADKPYWGDRQLGLAIFVARKLRRLYRVPITLPESVTVGKRFSVRSLLPLLEDECSYHVLTLSENHVSLYEGDSACVKRIALAGLPENLQAFLNIDGVDRGAQVHSAAGGGTNGKQAAVFHGQGGESETAMSELKSYCRAVDQSVSNYLSGRGSPLLLAAVTRLATVYRSCNTYPSLLAVELSGNYDRVSPYQLFEAAWQSLQATRLEPSKKMLGRYLEKVGTAHVLDDPEGIVTAAADGRIEGLLYDPRAEVYGYIDDQLHETRITGRSEDDDLVNLAAVETLLHGGEIHPMAKVVPPSNSPLAAVLRY
ncbi:MAG: hypothetical protein R3E01_14670 [Pirellulaceae bacterium]|nr:hypothetical protein [Planctomycetales bacterium]